MTFVTYSNTGPFTNNVVPPGVSATFLNNVESFLDQIKSSAVADNTITSLNGAGQLNVPAAGGLYIGGHIVVSSPAGTDAFLNAPNVGGGHKCVLQVGGTRVLSVDQSGNTTIRGSLSQNGTP